jgi:hypothetical protein
MNLKDRIRLQVAFQMSRDDSELLDHYCEIFCEALDWVMVVIDEMECAEEKLAAELAAETGLSPATEALIEKTADNMD